MVITLAAEEEARRGLIAAVSHDLRTPLTSLRLLVDAIDDDLVTGSAMRHDYLGRIATNVHALSGLIDDLFELSRLESGDIRWTMERVQLDELVPETIDNAIRHTPADGSVVIRAAPATGDAIELVDRRLGAPRSRGTSATASSNHAFQGGDPAACGGAGLGLAISRAIIEAHGGRIWLADAKRGTIVRFRLPDRAQTQI